MSEFNKIKTVEELKCIDDNEVVTGYFSGLDNDPEPGNDKSKSFWHGWRNGMVDGKHATIDNEQIQLAREVVGTYRGLN